MWVNKTKQTKKTHAHKILFFVWVNQKSLDFDMGKSGVVDLVVGTSRKCLILTDDVFWLVISS